MLEFPTYWYIKSALKAANWWLSRDLLCLCWKWWFQPSFRLFSSSLQLKNHPHIVGYGSHEWFCWTCFQGRLNKPTSWVEAGCEIMWGSSVQNAMVYWKRIIIYLAIQCFIFNVRQLKMFGNNISCCQSPGVSFITLFKIHLWKWFSLSLMTAAPRQENMQACLWL